MGHGFLSDGTWFSMGHGFLSFIAKEYHQASMAIIPGLEK